MIIRPARTAFKATVGAGLGIVFVLVIIETVNNGVLTGAEAAYDEIKRYRAYRKERTPEDS